MEFSGQYLTYNEYKALGGNLDITPFNLLEYEARRKVDERTQQRLKNVNDIPQEVKMCVYALVNDLVAYSNNTGTSDNKNIASESVGSYSVSYITGSQIQETIKSKNAELDNTITTYLTGVVVNGEHIIYLGVC